MAKSFNDISKYYKGLILIFILLIFWEIAVELNFVSNLVLPKPSKILKDGITMLSAREFYINFFSTLYNWFFAFIVGMSFGLFLGFLAGINRQIEYVILPLSAFIRSIPPIALFPVFLILIGPGKLPIIIAGIIGVVIYVFPIAHQAAESSRIKYSDLSHVLDFNRTDFIEIFIIPSTIINSIISSRIAASYLFSVCIGGEIIIGGKHGIGAAILEYSEKYRLEDAYFYIIIAGILGLIIDLSFAQLQKSFSNKT